MSVYDKETKFYWLQLKEDFFEDDAIEWLEEQKPNGRDYAYFYLKLCLKSLKSNGILIRQVGNILIPYDNKKLAELTKMDFDTVTVAMELLKQIGLVKILDNGEIYITQLENLIGSISKGALKKQQQRSINMEKKMIEQTNGRQMSTKDKDKDKVKDKDKDINNNMSCKIEEIINYLNKPDTDEPIRSFRKTSNNTRSIINARLKEGFTIDDFKDVIFYKYNQWVKKPVKFQNGVMSDTYYRPETLFCSKNFENYLQEYRDKSK